MFTIAFGLAALAAMVGFCIIPDNSTEYVRRKPIKRKADVHNILISVVVLCIIAMVFCAGMGW